MATATFGVAGNWCDLAARSSDRGLWASVVHGVVVSLHDVFGSGEDASAEWYHALAGCDHFLVRVQPGQVEVGSEVSLCWDDAGSPVIACVVV